MREVENNPFAWEEWLRAEALADVSIRELPPPVREGRIFAFVLRHLPIGIPEDATFAGDFGVTWASPAETAALTAFTAKEAARRKTGKTLPSSLDLLNARFSCRPSNGGRAHTTVDYERIVRCGVSDLLAQVERVSHDSDKAEREVLRGMTLALEGLVDWSMRYTELALELSRSTADVAERERLDRMAERCANVPLHPARSFGEALQAIWLVHLGIGLSERSAASISLGRLDQVLYPLFVRDLDRGRSMESLESELTAFLRVLNTFGDSACNVNLGPAEPGTGSHFNDLSRMIVRLLTRLRLPSPILALRVVEDTPDEVYDLVLDPALLEMGQPSFYGESPCREALRCRGISEADIDGWAANSCMGLMVPGSEWSNMWGSVVNCLLPLELATNGGTPYSAELPIRLPTPVPDRPISFEKLFTLTTRLLDWLVELLVSETAAQTQARGREEPNPFVSALLADCIVRRKDRMLGGCRYHSVIVEAFGLVNAADALLAIRRLVFETHRYELAELVAAAQANFAGRMPLLNELRALPKYGNGDGDADEMCRRLAAAFADSVRRHSENGIDYAPSFHTLASHIPAGTVTAASLDGRQAGEPLAKNIGTSPGRNRSGHTGLMLSAATIDQREFFGGQALDISVLPGSLSRGGDRRKLQALLQTYFLLGGLQVQVNAVSPDTLRRAMAEPELHRDVLVRKAGFTTRYVTLPRAEQAELIERLKAGL